MKKMTKNLLMTGIGLGISGVFNTAFSIAVARVLSPEHFGALMLVLTLVIFSVDVLSLSVGTSFIRFAGQSQPVALGAWVRKARETLLLSGLILTMTGLVLAWPLANIIWNEEELFFPIFIAALLSGSFLLFGHVQVVLQAQARFLLRAIFLVSMSSLRLLFLMLMIIVGLVTVLSALLAYILPLFLIGTVALFFLRGLPDDGAVPEDDARAFGLQRRWMMLFFFLVALYARVDTFLLFRLAGASATGVYQAVQRLFLFVLEGTGTVSTVFAPSFTRAKSPRALKAIFLQMAPFVGIGFIGLLVLFPWIDEIARFVYSEKYTEIGVIAMIWTFVVIVGSVLTLPFVTFLVYRVGAGRFLTYHAFGVLLIAIALHILLQPRFGATGAAIAVLVTSVIGLLVYVGRTGVFFQKLRKNE